MKKTILYLKTTALATLLIFGHIRSGRAQNLSDNTPVLPQWSLRADLFAPVFREVGLAGAYHLGKGNYLEAEAGYVYKLPHDTRNQYWLSHNRSVYRASEGWYAGLNYQLLVFVKEPDVKNSMKFQRLDYLDFALRYKRTRRPENSGQSFLVYNGQQAITGEKRNITGLDARYRRVYYLSDSFFLDVFLSLGFNWHNARQTLQNYPYAIGEPETAKSERVEDIILPAGSVGLRLHWNP